MVKVVGAHPAATHCCSWTWSAEAPLLCHSQCSSLCTDRAGETDSLVVEIAEKAVTMTLLFYGSYSSEPCLAANWPLLECSCYLQNQR